MAYQNPFTHAVDILVNRLELLIPNRIISRDYIHHSHRQRDELLKGILSVLQEKFTDDGTEWSGYLKLIIAGQIEVPGKNNDGVPFDITVTENDFAYQVRAALRNLGNDLPKSRVVSVNFSAQMDFPHGWFAFDVIYGPISEACFPEDVIYPPSITVSDLKTLHVDIDSEPHETRAEHEKWLEDDYSTSVPEAQIDMEFDK